MHVKVLNFIRSSQFFVAVVALFVVESAWIAVSAAFPGAFDENWHFQLIQVYGHQLSPFVSINSDLMNPSGAVARDPSFLYHYVLGFPYRLIALFTHSIMIQVILLRLLNVAFFAIGLVLFRKLLLKTKVSPAIINITFLLFILIPVVPLLASQINYDNLIMPLAALALIWTLQISDELRRGHLPLAKSVGLLTLCLFASMVQIEFLPILLVVVAWVGWLTVRAWRLQRTSVTKQLRAEWQQSTAIKRLLVTVPLLVAVGFFVQMYGLNVVAYHNLTPKCPQVLTVEQCQSDYAWVRTQEALAHKPAVNTNPLLFTASWTYRYFIALFYTASGGAGPQAWYLSVNPLPIVFVTALAVFGLGMMLAVRYGWSIVRSYPYLGFLLVVAITYSLALWFINYRDFYEYGLKVAMNGRYLFPILLPVMVIVALAYRQLLAQRRPQVRMGLLAVVVLLFLQGGGALTYITYSNSEWYWKNGLSLRLNTAAQRVVKPLIVIKSPIRSFGVSK